MVNQRSQVICKVLYLLQTVTLYRRMRKAWRCRCRRWVERSRVRKRPQEFISFAVKQELSISRTRAETT